MKYLSIIGSTGSIGTQTLDVVSQHPDQFKVVALVAHHNIDLLEKQIKEYNEMIEKEMAEKKAAYQSGEAYRRGSEDIIDVDYVEKEEK